MLNVAVKNNWFLSATLFPLFFFAWKDFKLFQLPLFIWQFMTRSYGNFSLWMQIYRDNPRGEND